MTEPVESDVACDDCGEYDLPLTVIPDPSGGKPIQLCADCRQATGGYPFCPEHGCDWPCPGCRRVRAHTGRKA